MKKRSKNFVLYIFLYILHIAVKHIDKQRKSLGNSAQINFNNWILCTTKKCQSYAQKLSPHLGVKTKSVLMPLVRCQPPLPPMALYIIFTSVILKRVPWRLQKNSGTILQNDFFVCNLRTFKACACFFLSTFYFFAKW